MSFLLDTNVISEVRKREPDPAVSTWLAQLRTEQISLSVLTIGELRRGIRMLARKAPARARTLDDWVSQLEQTYEDRLLPVTTEIATRWGEINSAPTFPAVDSLLAATALEHGLILATRNEKDFADTGVTVFNPFS